MHTYASMYVSAYSCALLGVQGMFVAVYARSRRSPYLAHGRGASETDPELNTNQIQPYIYIYRCIKILYSGFLFDPLVGFGPKTFGLQPEIRLDSLMFSMERHDEGQNTGHTATPLHGHT